MGTRSDRRHHRLVVAATSAAFGALIVGGAARAQSMEAEALVNEGRKLMNERRWAQACEAFEASNRIKPRTRTLLRLGECRELNQQLASAWAAYRDALAGAREPRWRDLATVKVAELQSQLSYLTVSVSDESWVEGLMLTYNGKPLEPIFWNRTLLVDGGDYVIAGRAPGREEWRTLVHVPVEGARVSVEVPKLEEVRASPPPPACDACPR